MLKLKVAEGNVRENGSIPAKFQILLFDLYYGFNRVIREKAETMVLLCPEVLLPSHLS